MFKKILIANRGEIAVRIARTCRLMGVESVAVYSDADKEALHVSECDFAEAIGPAPVTESYLKIDKIIEAAKKHDAQAIHPGYGLFSESAAAATAITEAGLVFIGPKPETLQRFGNKLEARALAQSVDVPVLPGKHVALDAVDEATDFAESIEWPVLVKAAAGGGGIGMQLAKDATELASALRTCSDRAARAFGDGMVYVEKYVPRARHVEVQVLCDGHGNIKVLGERECSVQRRHQKVIEETPAPALIYGSRGEIVREGLFDAASRLMEASNYQNAGTCEFILDARGRFYFLEVNARLQVEHPVTEACTGLDLVEWQLRVAAGEALSDEVLRRIPVGHSMEVRVCAEDPAKGFLPNPGKIESLRWPIAAPGKVRIETGVQIGSEVTPFYDSLIAKVITYGPTRREALLMMDRVLAQTEIAPLKTNVAYLRKVLADESFKAGQYDVDLLKRIT